jgi:Tfp pilus assembly protein PilN
MIEINLLPEELKPKEENLTVLHLRQVLLFVLPAIFGLIVIAHLFLGALFLFKTFQYKSLDKRWMQFSSERQKVNNWKREYNVSSRYSEQMDKLISGRITVSDKMQALARVLPNGIWFNHLNFNQGKFKLRGSVVSLDKEQMRLLNVFLSQLKEDKIFFEDFVNLELGNVNMRTLGGFAIMDFVLEGDLKHEKD